MTVIGITYIIINISKTDIVNVVILLTTAVIVVIFTIIPITIVVVISIVLITVFLNVLVIIFTIKITHLQRVSVYLPINGSPATREITCAQFEFL
jgi:hypothetical protein